jgi:hypothetical protein
MPFFHDRDRSQLRGMYVEAWRRHRAQLPLEPLQAQIVAVIEAHPEYHAALEGGPERLARDYRPEGGETNPFLHMSLHLAVRDQVATDRPVGIATVHAALTRQFSDRHAAEHQMIECLGEALWRSQRSGLPPDETEYLESLQRLLRSRS